MKRVLATLREIGPREVVLLGIAGMLVGASLATAEDGGAKQRFQDWVLVHPMVCEADGGCEIRCRNGKRPRSVCRGGELTITCESPR